MVDKIKLSVNRQVRGKPSNEEMRGKYSAQFVNETLTPDELMEVLTVQGHPIAPSLTKRWRAKENFESVQAVLADFDHGEYARLETLAEHPYVKKWGYGGYTTPSDAPDNPRSRAVFILSEPITDPALYRRCYIGWSKAVFGNAPDSQTKDPTRQWFGNPGARTFVYGNVLPVDEFLKYADSAPPENQEEYAPLGGAFPEGISRNGSFYHYARQLAREGASPEFTLAVMTTWAKEQGQMGVRELDEDEIKKTVESAYKGIEPVESRQRGSEGSFADAFGEIPPVNWVVHNLFATGTVNVFVGPPGAGKTYALLDLCISVAQGTPWLTFQTEKVPVLFVDEESGRNRLLRRIRWIFNGKGISASTPLPASFTSLMRFDLRKPRSLDDLTTKIFETGAKLVVIDALIDIIPGADENASKDMQPGFQRLREIADSLDVCIIVVHHTGKNGDYRGSSAIAGAIDQMLSMVRAADDPDSEDYNAVILSSLKERDMAGKKHGARLIFDNDAELFRFEPLDKAPSKSNPRNKKGDGEGEVLAALLTGGQMPTEKLIEEVLANGSIYNEATIRNTITKLARDKKIKKLPKKAGKQAVWAIASTEDIAFV